MCDERPTYWESQARLRQGIINQLRRELRRAKEKVDQLQAGE